MKVILVIGSTKSIKRTGGFDEVFTVRLNSKLESAGESKSSSPTMKFYV